MSRFLGRGRPAGEVLRQATVDPRRAVVEATLRRAELPVTVGEVFGILDPNETMVARCRHSDGRDVIAKVAESVRGSDALERHVRALREVLVDAPPSLRHVLPQVLHFERTPTTAVALETAFPGTTLRTRGGARRARAERAALDALDQIHTIGTCTAVPSVEQLAAWLDEPLDQIRLRHGADDLDRSLSRLREELSVALARPLRLGRVHGDYWPGNLLVSPTGRLTGIVDWEASRSIAPVGVDLAQFGLFSSDEPIGDVLAAALAARALPPSTSRETGRALTAAADELGPRPALLLAWLWHVADNIRKSDSYADAWFATNVVAVLRTADATAA